MVPPQRKTLHKINEILFINHDIDKLYYHNDMFCILVANKWIREGGQIFSRGCSRCTAVNDCHWPVGSGNIWDIDLEWMFRTLSFFLDFLWNLQLWMEHKIVINWYCDEKYKLTYCYDTFCNKVIQILFFGKCLCTTYLNWRYVGQLWNWKSL